MSKARRSQFSRLKNYLRRVWPVLGPACGGDPRADGSGGVLILKRDNIGDFILATTFMNVAYRRWSGLPVTLACSEGLAGLAGLMYPNWSVRPVKDDFSEYKKSRWRPGPLQQAVRAWPMVDRLVNLRAMRFQEEMLFDSWVPARNKIAIENLFRYHEASYRMTPDKRVYSEVLPAVPGELPVVSREIAGHRQLVKHFFPNEDLGGLWPRLDFGPHEERLERVLEDKGFKGAACFAVCPFPSAGIKRYPMDQLTSIVSRVAQRHGLPVHILGGAGDRAEAVEFARKISSPQGARSFVGELSLLESLIAVSKAGLVLGVDTGLMHAAIAAGRPSVVILGGAHHGHFGPWGPLETTRWLSFPMPCYDCNWECSQPEPYCIRSIDPGLIEESLESVRGNAQYPAPSR